MHPVPRHPQRPGDEWGLLPSRTLITVWDYHGGIRIVMRSSGLQSSSSGVSEGSPLEPTAQTLVRRGAGNTMMSRKQNSLMRREQLESYFQTTKLHNQPSSTHRFTGSAARIVERGLPAVPQDLKCAKDLCVRWRTPNTHTQLKLLTDTA